jgi:hypothetical protein
MARWQDEWKTLYMTDSRWLRAKKDGSEPTLEIAEEVGEFEDEEGVTQKKFTLYRFEVERFKIVKDPKDASKAYLVSKNYEPSWPHPLKDYEEWFASDLAAVAKSVGCDVLELANAFCSSSPQERAGAYEDVGNYHGFANFDSEPLEINEPQLDKRWS